MSGERSTITPRTIVEAFLPVEGAVDLGLVYGTANVAGVADQPVRLCLRRMVAAGEIVQHGRGRQGSVSVTDAGRDRLARDRGALRFAFAQDRGEVRWDRHWRLLAVSAPETDRPARDLIRRTLVNAGAAPVSTGLFISPHDLAEMLDPRQRSRLVRASAPEVDVRGESDPQRLAEILWPQAPIVAAYQELEETVSEAVPAEMGSAEAALRAQLHLADGLERALRRDPLIPPELRGGVPYPADVRREWRTTWDSLAERLDGEVLYRGWLPPR